MMFPCFCEECVLRKSSHIYYAVAEVRSNAQLLYRFENKNKNSQWLSLIAVILQVFMQSKLKVLLLL